MIVVSVAQARAGLDALLEKVESGEALLITRDGPTAAVARAPSDDTADADPYRALAALRASRPPWRKPSAELLRELRDESL